MKRVLTAFILIFFPLICVNANMISFFIIETGLPENPDNNTGHIHSILWESAFMDVFFDAGFIVSNAPIMRLEEKPSGDILKTAMINLQDIREWGIDYIIVTQLDYLNDGKNPSSVLFLVYSITPEEKILEKNVKRTLNKNPKDEYEDLKAIVKGLVPFIK